MLYIRCLILLVLAQDDPLFTDAHLTINTWVRRLIDNDPWTTSDSTPTAFP